MAASFLTFSTSSLIKHLRPDLEVKPIRGNVDTRIKKVKRGEFDGIIVAEAGLKRMKLESQITERFSLEQFTSSAGQGALAVVARKDNEKIVRLLESVDHPPSRAEVTAETLSELGLRVDIMPDRYLFEEALIALARYWNAK